MVGRDFKRHLSEDVPLRQPLKRAKTPTKLVGETCPSYGDFEPEFSNQESTLRMYLQAKTEIIVSEIGKRPNAVEYAGNEANWQLKLPYDTCFGVLEMETPYCNVSSAETGHIPVQISSSGPKFKLRREDTGTSAGMLICDGLARLIREYDVTLTCILLAMQPQHAKKLRKNQMSSLWLDRSLRVLVYGFSRDKAAIAKLLSDHGLFLQNPAVHEYDSSVKFSNPQYLVRPGQDMSLIDSAFIEGNKTNRGNDASTELSEEQICKILAIFESNVAETTDDEVYIKQSPRLLTTLKRYQLEALRMMIEKEGRGGLTRVFPSLWREETNESGKTYQHKITGARQLQAPVLRGGVLADEMGLGKTLSALSLICYHLDMLTHTGLSTPLSNKAQGRNLIVTPLSTIYEWRSQIERHIRAGAVQLYVHHGAGRSEVTNELQSTDIVLTTYGTLRSEFVKTHSRPLFELEWTRIFLDEAHNIRTRSSKTFQAVYSLSSRFRWCLTGTPIQNNLDDFGALMAFIRVPPFTSKQAFSMWIEQPMMKKAPHCFQTLQHLVAATCLRRTKATCKETLSLPTKHEVIEYVELDKNEREIYTFFQQQSYMLATSLGPNQSRGSKVSSTNNTLHIIGRLRLICNHAEGLLPDAALDAWKNKDHRLSWGILEASIKRCDSCASDFDVDVMAQNLNFNCQHDICNDCTFRTQEDSDVKILNFCPVCSATSYDERAVVNQTTKREQTHAPSTKIQALLDNISLSDSSNEKPLVKCVVFSYWTRMLDIIQGILTKLGIKFQRIDGNSSAAERRIALDCFNTDNTVKIMLASIGAVGEGVDLTVASVVHLMEPQWNPMAEAQAIDRVHRIGQRQNVTIYRYIVNNSIESYVRAIQARKLDLIRNLSSHPDTGSSETEKQKRLLEYLRPGKA